MGRGESVNKLIFNYAIAILATGWMGLLSSSITFASDDLKFNRQCNTAIQCVFSPTGSSDRVYLDCKNGYCACARFTRIADVPVWDLNWSEPANGQLRECLIAETGPCGEDNSIKISCMTGLDCIEKRCRSRDNIKTHKLGESCKETIDCEQGLTCATTSFYFQPIKTCVDPQNPHPVTNRSNNKTDDGEPITTTSSTFIQQPTRSTARTTTTTTTTVQPENIATQKDSSSQSVVVMSNNSTEKSNVQMENFNGTSNTHDDDDDMPANRNNNAIVISSSIFSSLITVTTVVLVLSSSLLVE